MESLPYAIDVGGTTACEYDWWWYECVESKEVENMGRKSRTGTALSSGAESKNGEGLGLTDYGWVNS